MTDFHERLFTAIWQQLEPTGAQVVLGPIPTTGTAVGVAFYDVEPPEGTTDMVQGIQLQLRHEATNDRRATLALGEAVFLTLHGQSVTEWEGIPIHHVWRNSSADLGPDESGAVLRSDNYYVRASRSGPNLSDS